MKILKRGMILKLNCNNCFDDVKMHFCYEDMNILTFQCEECGVYNHYNKKEVLK